MIAAALAHTSHTNPKTGGVVERGLNTQRRRETHTEDSKGVKSCLALD